jgi:uncharacterized protein (DUF433 family)
MSTMQVVTVNKNVQGGTPCFAGTRVPVSTLFVHLKRGYSVAEFLADFPTVSKEQAEAMLDLANADVPLHAVRVGEP